MRRSDRARAPSLASRWLATGRMGPPTIFLMALPSGLTQLLLIALAAWAGAYARVAISPLQEVLRGALHLTDGEISVLQGPALALPYVVLAAPIGFMVDRGSRAKLLVAVTALVLAASVLSAVAPNFAILLLARSLVGVSALAINPLALSLIADRFTPQARGRATMAMAVGQFAGMAAAFAFGGKLALLGAGAAGYRSTMLWLCLPLAPVVVLMLAVRDPPRSGAAIINPSLRQAWSELGQFRPVIGPLLVAVSAAELALGAVWVWTAPALERNLHAPPDQLGGLMATGLLVSGVLGPLLGGALADLCQRWGGPRRTLLVSSGLGCLACPAGLYAMMPTTALAGLLLIGFMIILAAVAVTGSVAFTIVLPNELRGLCVSVLGAAGVLVAGVAPLLVTAVSSAIGGPLMLNRALSLVVVGASMTGAIAFAVSAAHYRPIYRRGG